MRFILAAALAAFVATTAAAESNNNAFDVNNNMGSGSGGSGGYVDLYEWGFTDKYKSQKDRRRAATLKALAERGGSTAGGDPGGAPNHGSCNCGR